MNSMPQQAVANGNGQRELRRPQATSSSRRVTKKSAPPGPPGFGGRTGSSPLRSEALIRVEFYCKRDEGPQARLRGRSPDVERIAERLHVLHAVEVHEPVEVIDLVLED